jgi:N-acetylneuraminate synthase
VTAAARPGLVEIQGRPIGPGHPVYIVAEMSANHGQRFEDAVQIIEAAKAAGAEAIKLQTYTADTLTLDADLEHFRIKGTAWAGRTLHELYREASTPWEWQPRLKAVADSLGLHCFSSPFDDTAVEFLEHMGVPAYKVASFELVDLALLRTIARTGKPMIVSTGMATLGEIEEAVAAIRDAGGRQVVLLWCTSAYPAPPDSMNLRAIPHLAQAFGMPVGLSDHTMGTAVSVAAAALGACVIEKHLTLSRRVPGPDSGFSLEPHEFKEMVDAVRIAERALGEIVYGPRGEEMAGRALRRSLFVVRAVKAGERFTRDSVRSIRPGGGLAPRHLDEVLGRYASRDIERGTPLSWDLIAGPAS